MKENPLENDNSPLVEQWAQLLVSATNNYSEQLITFTEILSQLGHEDAKILEEMKGKFIKYNNSLGNFLELYGILPNRSELDVKLESTKPSEFDFPVDQEGRYFLSKGVTIANPFSTGSLKVYDSNEPIYRLDHLGLVKICSHWTKSYKANNAIEYWIWAVLTPFGFSFVSECNGK